MTGRADVWVVLLRGINVNPSTRVAMADLRALLSGLGFEDVRTVLQSGNVLLKSPKRPAVGPIEAAIVKETGVQSKVVVLSLADFRRIAAANPLLADSGDHPRDDLSKMVITFLDGDIVPDEVERPSEAALAPESLVVTTRSLYQWFPDGILRSKLKPSWYRQFGPTLTARNARTVNRILAAADSLND
jgi:uncharacterized protein (DUF1697 family)